MFGIRFDQANDKKPKLSESPKQMGLMDQSRNYSLSRKTTEKQ